MTPPRPTTSLAGLLCLAWLCAPAQAQEQLDVYAGIEAGDGLSVFAEVGDIDGDGIVEHLAGAPEADGQRGSATLFRGADGAVLHTFVGELAGDRFGQAVSGLGDVDGDGVPDLAVGAPGQPGSGAPGTVYLLSGADHSVLDRLVGPEPDSGFGFALSGVGDVDGDGAADVLVGAPFTGADRGRACVFSGADGSLLLQRDGASDGDTYGYSLDGSLAVGDGSPEPVIGEMLGSDGSPEPIIGAPQLGNGGPGYVEFLHDADFSLLNRCDGSQPGERFGWAVTWAGDVDADGVLDAAVSSSPVDAQGQPFGPASVRVFSGASGLVLFTFVADAGGTGFGDAIAGIGDVDGDGHDDLAVGEPFADGKQGPGSQCGSVWIFDGDSGQLAHRIHGSAGARLGTSVAYAGDVDLDGKADAAVGAPGADANGSDSGMVVVFAFARWINLDGGLPGLEGTPALSGAGEPAGGAQIALTVEHAPPETPVTLIVGDSLTLDGLTGALAPTPLVLTTGLLTDAAGSLVVTLQLPETLGAHAVLYYQVVFEDPELPGGISRSNALASHVE